MASTANSQIPIARYFDLGEGIQLEVKVYGSTYGKNRKVELQLRNCSRELLLHWGAVYHGQANWVLPTDPPVGTRNYKEKALQTPFLKRGEFYLVVIELCDPKICAIEFVLKDERRNKWFKQSQQNFRIGLPEDAKMDSSPSIPKELVERKAYMLWESKGRPRCSQQQEQENYEIALRELQIQLSKGTSLTELQHSVQSTGSKRTADEKEIPVVDNSATLLASHTRHDVGQLLRQQSNGHAQRFKSLSSGLMGLVENSMGVENVIYRQSFHAGNHEIVVIMRADNHILVAVNMKGVTVLHWGVSRVSFAEWLVPPSEMFPKRSKLVDGACQTYFNDMTAGEQFFQFVDIDLQQSDFVGIHFIIWSGGSWIKNNGSNFSLNLKEINSKCGQSTGSKKTADQKEIRVVDNSAPSSAYHRRHDVGQWLHQQSNGQLQNSSSLTAGLMDLVEKSMGGENVIFRQSFHASNHEIVVILRGDYHILVAVNMKGATVLHWGVSRVSFAEWLVPPSEMFPKRSKLVDGACQTYFNDMTAGERVFQFVDIDLQRRDFVGIHFIIWSGGSWIKNNGANFSVNLKEIDSKCGQGDGIRKGIVKWLLDEISQREKDAERSLMHRFDIATELTERCKGDGDLGLIGIMVWLRFMACRQLTWNKNYNVKPREISAAQDKFTNLLQRIYSDQPNQKEIVRLIMASIGRGGQGDVGQRIRDEILVLQRNNDCKGGMMEEWHQKLHNNSSPDDVIICQALLDYVRSDFKLDVYWRTLNASGLTKSVLRSYDRPIVSEPNFRAGAKEGLIRDLTSYLKTLKAVHTGADLESAIEMCLGYFSEGSDFMKGVRVISVGDLPSKLQENLNYVKMHVEDKNIGPLMEKLLESRVQLRPLLLTSHERLKDLIFLDLALDSTIRTTMERGLKDLSTTDVPRLIFFIALMLQSLCLSTVKNEDLVYCTKDWERVCETYEPNNEQWALKANAVIDRIRLTLSDKSQYYLDMIQPSAQYLGSLLRVEKWAIDIFTEELIRAGSAPTLSLLVNRLDPILRKIANLGCWQIISPVEVSGFVTSINELITVQTKVYKQPTIIIANKVSGEEEIPDGVVGVITSDMPDVLSHVSVRARNSKVCFATCFDQNILRNLKLKEGKAISIKIKSTNLVISDISSSDLSRGQFTPSSIPRGTTLTRKTFAGKYALAVEEFTNEMVGAKSRNIQYLRGRVPPWIKIPTSVAIPFGVFETLLASDMNRDLSNKVSAFGKLISGGDLSKLLAVQETILQMKAPSQLVNELRIKLKSSGIPWPGDEGEERWNQAWQAIKKVWASKWNQRAYISCRKANLNHDHLCMSVLVQEIISADYAFVIHTRNPLTGDSSEIYAEVVKGLGETLVGAYAGRAMSFIVKKSDLNSPTVVGYPSKQIGLYIKKSLIFRSDSNGEDLEGYAGAGLYDSVPMDKEQKIVVDYSTDRLINDKDFQRVIFSKIAEVGKIIENLYRSAQDIEGVVKNGEIYVVQTRPQI